MRNFIVIILVFLTCSVSYEFACRRLANTSYDPSAQHLWDANLIRLENFLFPDDNRMPQSVLVGTSLSARLGDRFLPNDDSLNLSFAGGSPITVLKILSAMDSPPRNIIIEMNYIDKPVSMSLIEQYTSPLTIFLKKNLLSWRERYKPITALKTLSINFIEYLKKIEKIHKESIKISKDIQNPSEKASGDQGAKILTINLEKQMDYYSTPPKFDQDLIVESILLLKEKKSNIFLLNMPIHEKLYETKRMAAVLKFQDSIMAKTGARLMQIGNAGNIYETTDGLHLKPTSLPGVRGRIIGCLDETVAPNWK